MDTYILRPITEKNNAEIAAVIRSVLLEFGVPKVGSAYADPALQDMYAQYCEERKVYYVVEFDGVILGGAGIQQLEGYPQAVCELQKMYLAPEARGKGLATRLLNRCLDFAVSAGFNGCYLETMLYMHAARKRYEEFGFTYLNHPMGATGHFACTVWMYKELKPHTEEKEQMKINSNENTNVSEVFEKGSRNIPNETIQEYRTFFYEQLQALQPITETRAFFEMLAEHILGIKRFEIPLHLQRQLETEEKKRLDDALKQLQQEVPIQYILKETTFMGFPFSVSPAVLIPRPETEELVHWIASQNTKSATTLLDIGTGSGCIAISLAKLLDKPNVYALDVSEEALNLAKSNAIKNAVPVHFMHLDVLRTDTLPRQFDVVVSNPPYVTPKEKDLMHNNVLNHEPYLALFVPQEDPLLFYRKITQLAAKHLQPGGQLFFEINEAYGKETALLVEQHGFKEVAIKKDMYGKDRMVRGVWCE